MDTLHVHTQCSQEKCHPEGCPVSAQALASHTTASESLGPWHCPTTAHGTLGGMGSLCANELFLNNDLTWFRE